MLLLFYFEPMFDAPPYHFTKAVEALMCPLNVGLKVDHRRIGCSEEGPSPRYTAYSLSRASERP